MHFPACNSGLGSIGVLLIDLQSIKHDVNQLLKAKFHSIFEPGVKTFITFISFFCYFIVTSGVIINSHYCMNRLASVHLYETVAEKCGKCGMNTHQSDGCCRDEVKIVKLDQDHNKIPVTLFALYEISADITIPSEFIAADFKPKIPRRHFHNHSPPLLSAQDTYLLNSVFRI